MMCRQVLPDTADGIEQIYIVKTEPGLEDDGGQANMVPETVDQIKTEPADDFPADEAGFETVDVIIKEEPKVDSDSDSQVVDTKINVKAETLSKDRVDIKKESKQKPKAKVGKKDMKHTKIEPQKEKKQNSSSKEKADKEIEKEKLFSCHLCDKKTNNQHNLRTHLKTHDSKKNKEKEIDRTCKICNKICFSKQCLKKHLESHERKAMKPEKKKKAKLEKLQRFVCHYCPSKYTTYWNLRRHEDLHDIPPEQQIHKRKEFFCYVCDNDFGSKEGLQEHLYSHADRLPYSCTECDKPACIKSVRFLNQHLEMHKDTTNGSIKCTWCPLRFHSLKGCKLHERTHVSQGGSALEALERRASILSKRKNVKVIIVDGVLRFACDRCDKSYSLMDSLRDHFNTHTDKPKKLHVCRICNKVFAFAGGLHAHELVHSDALPYKCEYCDKAFKAAVRLIEHRRTHTGERPFVCKCGVAFAKRFTMMSHKKICLTPELLKSCSCRICGDRVGVDKSFPSYAELIRHVTEEHTEPIPRTKCNFCPALSQSPLLLVRHEHRHQMPNVIQCKQCNRIFKNKALLEEHEIMHKPQSFICDICGMTFNRLKRFEKHSKTHAYPQRKSGKVYSCELCPKSFRWLGNFRSHQKLHYNEKSRYFIPSLVQGPPPEPDLGEDEAHVDFGMFVKTEME
uniref:C2H2-type domain-containing protein n=1 Tax=Culex tarsalis TaxID=7177 RepID=A0A1Q3FLM4_CULTA